jgi:hypothetical protein
MPLHRFLDALAHDFQGIDDRSNFFVQVDVHQHYDLYHQRFGIHRHSFTPESEVIAENFVKGEAKRLCLLRRKFLETLDAGEKILVFRRNTPLRNDEIASLFRALRDRGPNTLLIVTEADAGHPAGAVDVLEEGLMRGYVDRLAPSDKPHMVSTGSWLEVCRSTLAIWEESGAKNRLPAVRALSELRESRAIPESGDVLFKLPARAGAGRACRRRFRWICGNTWWPLCVMKS